MLKGKSYFDIPWHTQKGAGGVVGILAVVRAVTDEAQVLTNAIHDLDMLQYWLGDIAEVFAMEGPKERPFDVDSTVQLSFKFSSGVVGSFLLSEYV